jgi:Skp family chaperone for outer membrane proteins
MAMKPRLLTFFFLALACAGLAQRNRGKGAFVDLDKVVQVLPETKVAQDKLDSSISYLKRVHLLFEDSVRLVMSMVPHDGPLNTETKLYYEQRLKKVKDDLANFEKEAHAGLSDFREKLYAPLRQTAIKLSTVVAQAYHYSALVEKNKKEKVLYSEGPLTDITDIVIEEIKKHTAQK